jgi:hypothetical protein
MSLTTFIIINIVSKLAIFVVLVFLRCDEMSWFRRSPSQLDPSKQRAMRPTLSVGDG